MTMAMFQAQLNTMVTWFDQWNESGQTVALFKMLTRLAPVQARFVAIALEHSLTECAELALREQEANNPGFVSGLLCESKECAMSQTLVHLPLLRPGNTEAKHCYLALVPALLGYTVESGCLVEEARQLLSYVLIHPALKDDRKIFEPWRRSLGERIVTGSKPSGTPLPVDLQQKTRRSNSLTPPFAVTPNNEWTSQDDLVVHGKVRRFSLSSEQSGGPPLSPQSSQASSGSGSETQLDTAGYDNPVMKDVKSWLKSLRLHKYWRFFSQLTYEQMLSLNEDNFEMIVEQVGGCSVTQGARRKIILSVAKLRERSLMLQLLEEDVMGGSAPLLPAIEELKLVLGTPIKAYPEDELAPYDDLPSQLTRVLGKICSQLMVSNCSDDDVLSGFIGLLDLSIQHDAFTQCQKKKISSWRLQVSQLLRQTRVEGGRLMPQVVYLQASPPPPTHRGLTPPLSTSPLATHHPPSPNHPLQFGGPLNGSKVKLGGPSLHLPPPHLTLVDTEPEINSRLESLCLSVTEHALGPSES